MTSGIVISQGSVDVEQAADYQKSLDSRWKFLEIAKEAYLEVDDVLPADATGIKLLEHNLDYLPFYTAKVLTGGGNVDQWVYDQQFKATTNAIYCTKAGPFPFTVFIRVYALDVTQEYMVPGLSTDTKEVSKAVHGAKVLRESHFWGMKAKDKTAYTLNPDAKAMSVLAHGVRDTDAGEIVVQHDVGYPPTFFLSTYDGQTLREFNAVIGLGRSDNNRLIIGGAQGVLTGKYAFTILKDPVQVAK